MKNGLKIVVLAAVTAFFLPHPAASMQAPVATPSRTTSANKANATLAPSAQAIADAKSAGQVWVNLGSGAYHKDGEFYGKTKRGKFMSEADARKAGYREAGQTRTSKAGNASIHKKTAATSGTDSTESTHKGNTPPPGKP